jgi:hypothetical protein
MRFSYADLSVVNSTPVPGRGRKMNIHLISGVRAVAETKGKGEGKERSNDGGVTTKGKKKGRRAAGARGVLTHSKASPSSRCKPIQSPETPCRAA